MTPFDFTPLADRLKERLVAKLGNRVRRLEVRCSDEGIELSGEAPTYHVKQIAQHSVGEMMPQARLTNGIVVL